MPSTLYQREANYSFYMQLCVQSKELCSPSSITEKREREKTASYCRLVLVFFIAVLSNSGCNRSRSRNFFSCSSSVSFPLHRKGR